MLSGCTESSGLNVYRPSVGGGDQKGNGGDRRAGGRAGIIVKRG